MPRIKVLPVCPEYPRDTFWSGSHALGMIGKKTSIPPLGLLTAMAMMSEDKFDILPVSDLNVRPLNDEQIKNADIIAVSAMTVQKKSLDEVIQRTLSLGKKVIQGGPHATTFWEGYTSQDGVSSVLGEAEITLPELVRDLASGKSLRKVYRPEECCLDGLKLDRAGRPDLSQTPIPKWNIIDLKDYYSLAIQFSRGCPYECEFCDITKLFGRNPRTKGTEQMIKEFDAVYSSGWKGQVFLVDDNLIGNKPKIRELVPKIIEWQKERNYPFILYTEASMELGDPQHKELLDQMVLAGFDQVFVGIESLDPDVIKQMGKHQNNADQKKRVEAMQRAGLEVTSGFIVGNDQDKPEVFDQLFNFIQETGIVVPMPGLLGAPPGTHLYERLEKEGRLREAISGDNTHGLEMNFIPKMDEKVLIDGYVHLLERLFDAKNYYARCEILNSRRGKTYSNRTFDETGVTALKNIAYENLIHHPDWQFMKHITKTVFIRPRTLPEAIAQAIKLHHFRTITSSLVTARGYQNHVQTAYEKLEHLASNLKENVSNRFEEARKAAEHTLKDAEERYHSLSNTVQAKVKPYLDKLKDRISKYNIK